jgi:hypothetical protein
LGYSKIEYEFDPIGDVEVDDKQSTLKEIASVLRDEILSRIADGVSPVSGHRWRSLNRVYAETEKSGDDTANLDLTGDMLNRFTVKVRGNKLVVMVDGNDELTKGKVEGHNQHDDGLAHPLPKRRFIPDDSQTFAKPIMREIADIVKEHAVERTADAEERVLAKSVADILLGGGEVDIDRLISMADTSGGFDEF